MKVIENNHKRTENSPDLFREERRQAILERLAVQGRVAVAELSAAFGVSEVTVRRIYRLWPSASWCCARTAGPSLPGRISGLALVLRRRRQVKEKGRIGAALRGAGGGR